MACDVLCVLNQAHIRRPVTPHVLCPTFAVTAVQKGISLSALQQEAREAQRGVWRQP